MTAHSDTVTSLLSRVRALFGRGRRDDEMQDEMRQHLDRAAERLMARGMSPDEARLAARREFGNVTVIQEDARDARGMVWVDELSGNLRFAFRYFARNKAPVAIIIAVLTLGIGVNSALFSVIQAFIGRPAPAVPRDDTHVRIYGLEQTERGARWRTRGFSYPELEELEKRSEIFADVAGWTSHDVVLTLPTSGTPRGVQAEFVTPNYFRVLGVSLVAGPGLGPHDADTPDFSAVLSFSLAERFFGALESAVGQSILVNEVPVRVAGVAPRRFQGAIPNSPLPEIWLPVSARAPVARVSPQWLTHDTRLMLFARIASPVSQEQATTAAQEIAARFRPDSAARAGVVRSSRVLGMRDMPPSTGPDDELFAVAGLGLVALLILLVACTSVSSLLVASGIGRRHEIAVRLSMGASRGRVLRQLLTESSLLSLVAGVLGLLLYWWLVTFISNRAGDVNVDLTPDLGTVAFTALFALGTGILFGLSPALHATRTSLSTALQDAGGGSARRSRLQRTLVVTQVALSQPLLVLLGAVLVSLNSAAGLNWRSAVADRVISTQFRALARTGTAANRQEAVDTLARDLRETPGVVAVVHEPATFAVRTVAGTDSVTMEPAQVEVRMEGATPGFFRLMDVPIVMGRDISFADTAGDRIAVVVGSDVARTIWGDVNPIGRTLAPVAWRLGARDSTQMHVVGVYDASRATTLAVRPGVFTAHGARWRRDGLLVRTREPADAFLPTLREMIRDNAPGLPVTGVTTRADIEAGETRELVLVSGAAAGAGMLALLLASIGLYGVISLAVSQRRREIGIRIAVGGSPARIVRMFFASGVRVGALALLMGLPLSLAGLRVGLSQGFVIAPAMSVVVVGLGVATVMLAVTSIATWVPARRAANVHPALVLKSD